MWHLFKNRKKQFEIAFIFKGRYIAGSKQGYERRAGCMKAFSRLEVVRYQDDTENVPGVWLTMGGGRTYRSASIKPTKRWR